MVVVGGGGKGVGWFLGSYGFQSFSCSSDESHFPTHKRAMWRHLGRSCASTTTKRLFVVALNPSFAGNLYHPSAASAHSSTLRLRKIEESTQVQVQVCMITNSRYREEEEEE